MALCALRDGGVKIGDGLQGDPELSDEGLYQERMGCDDTVIGGEGYGRFDGLETLGDDLGVAHMMLAEEGLEGGTASELRRLEGRPATQEVAEDGGVFLLKPVQHLRDIVLEGPGQAVGAPYCVADHAATVCDELCEGAHRGALWLERLPLVAVGQQQVGVEVGIPTGVLRAGRGRAWWGSVAGAAAACRDGSAAVRVGVRHP